MKDKTWSMASQIFGYVSGKLNLINNELIKLTDKR